MARINAKLGFVTVIEKEEEENLDVNEAMMEDTIDVVSKFETEYVKVRFCQKVLIFLS